MPRNISFGIISLALGTLAVVGAEDAFSAMQRNQCRNLGGSHKVIALRGFTGTNHFCVNTDLL